MKFASVLRAMPMAFVFVAMIALPQVARADQKAVADARKNLADAQAAAKTAQATFDKAKEPIQAQLAKSPEYAEATKILTKAKADLAVAMKALLDKVHASPEYTSAKKAFDDADA